MLTIISVTKDDLGGISRTIASTKLLRKNENVKQLIIDSSLPDCQQKVKALCNIEQNVEYIWQNPLGIAPAFNFGISLVDTEWIWFLNGGDEMNSECDMQLLIALLKFSTADALIFELEYTSGVLNRPSMPFLWPPVYNWIPHPATLIRTSVLKKVNGFNEKYKIAMDGELWIRLFGDKINADLISIPLTIFAPGGVSENVARTAKEVSKLIWEHKYLLFKRWLQNGVMILRAWKHFWLASR